METRDTFDFSALARSAKAGDARALELLRERLKPATDRQMLWYAPPGRKAELMDKLWAEVAARLGTLHRPDHFRTWLFCLGRELCAQARGESAIQALEDNARLAELFMDNPPVVTEDVPG